MAISTFTLQNEIDAVQAFPDIEPTLSEIAGYAYQPAIAAANDVDAAIFAQTVPWKFNDLYLPPFFTASFQQDYPLLNPDGSSVTNVGWLCSGICVMTNSTAQQKPTGWVRCGRRQDQSTGAWGYGGWRQPPTFTANVIYNYQAYTGVWGDAAYGNTTFGNNPQPSQTITSPLGSGVTQPNNPVTFITDSNGNLQTLTTYGTTGSSEPVWPAANATPGTTTDDGSCVWTVVDPNGYAVRLTPVPGNGGGVWQLNLIAQAQPTKYTTLGQNLNVPDGFESHWRQGFVTQLLRYSKFKNVRERFVDEWKLWMQSLAELNRQDDREKTLDQYVPATSILNAGRTTWGPNSATWAWPGFNPWG